MYKINATIQGVSPILQHAFGKIEEINKPKFNPTGKKDYTLEWMDTMYVRSDGLLGQPAMHIEGAMTAASTAFKMTGKKTWRDAVRAYVIVSPDMIPHQRDGEFVTAPDSSLVTDPTEHLKVNIMRVVVQRAAVARSRLEIAAGWQLNFEIQVIEKDFPAEVLKQILEEAGRRGIGDYRPRYGRFQVVGFDAA